MSIVPQSQPFSFTFSPPPHPLLPAPKIAGLLPATITTPTIHITAAPDAIRYVQPSRKQSVHSRRQTVKFRGRKSHALEGESLADVFAAEWEALYAQYRTERAALIEKLWGKPSS